MDDQFTTYTVIMDEGVPLSPTEDLDTTIIAAAHAQALGQSVARIEQRGAVILEGTKLIEAIARHARDAQYP